VSTAGTGNLNITGDLTLNNNSTFNVTKNIPGNLGLIPSVNNIVLNSGSNLNLAAGLTYFQLTGNWINNGGTLNATPPTEVRFEGIGNSIGGSSSTNFPILRFGNTLNNVNYQINQNISCQDLVLDKDNSYRQVFVNSPYTVTVNGNLIINQPSNNSTNVMNVNGGVLNILGNCNFAGNTSSGTQVGKLVVTSGHAIINGNVNWMSNTTVLSEQIEVNSGTLTLVNDLNMPQGSGVMNVTGPGVVNFNGNTLVSLNLNSGAGTPAQLNTVNGCTLNFAKGITNSNVPLILANGSYAVFTGNSAITPNAAITFGHVYINNGITLTLNGDISVQNDWMNAGGNFVPNNRRVSFVGTGQQIISKAGGETFYDVTSNTTGPIFLNDDVTILNNLTMTAGNFNLNNKILYLGNNNTSSLIRTSGILYNGEFRRWWPSGAIISSSSGNFYGLFPIGTSTEYRPVMINSSTSPSGAGYLGAFHTIPLLM